MERQRRFPRARSAKPSAMAPAASAIPVPLEDMSVMSHAQPCWFWAGGVGGGPGGAGALVMSPPVEVSAVGDGDGAADEDGVGDADGAAEAGVGGATGGSTMILEVGAVEPSFTVIISPFGPCSRWEPSGTQ